MKNWDKDFKEFLEVPNIEPPVKISEIVLTAVSRDLHPSPWFVFMKLVLVTTIAGLASLLVCPQFGFGDGIGLMRFFMKLGATVCQIACGAVFIGLGMVVAAFVFRPEELRILRQTRLLQVTLLAFISLGGFVCAGAEIFFTLAFFWILGAILGGLFIFEISYCIRFARLSTHTA